MTGRLNNENKKDTPEQILLQHSHSRNDPWFPARAQPMKLHIRADHSGCKLGVGSRARAAAADILCYIMDLASRSLLAPAANTGNVKSTFSQFLSATMGPSVARVSAPSTMPSLNRHPTMVVPVLVALGRGRPFSERNAFLSGVNM